MSERNQIYIDIVTWISKFFTRNIPFSCVCQIMSVSWDSLLIFSYLFEEKSILNLVNPNQILIIIFIFYFDKSFHICQKIIKYAFQWTNWLKKRSVSKIMNKMTGDEQDEGCCCEMTQKWQWAWLIDRGVMTGCHFKQEMASCHFLFEMTGIAIDSN